MAIKILKPRKAINKAFLKLKPNRTDIECFKTNLIQLLDRTNTTESEEFHKNLVSDFLKDTYYKNIHFINTKGRNDLVIHNGAKAKSPVGVIIEAKKPTNKAEMLSAYTKGDTPQHMRSKINVKAFHELVLYYLRERIIHKNLEIKHVVATNINEWFIFDANVFEKQFAQNNTFVKQFNDFENGRLAGKTTDFFYKEIAQPYINSLSNGIEFTYFDIRDYETPLRNNSPKDDTKLIALFKLLSPEHLLKRPFSNDSNSLDKRFYGELLHIIGLSETKNGSKKLIERHKEGQRHSGAFLENAIIQLDSLDKINRLDNPSHFGASHDERLFNVGLELSITWINRILFLKLLEAQLKTYHKGDKSYAFLSIEKIRNYDDLNSLFFQVLAKQHTERNNDVKALFEKVPYLNSSLFEPTEIEHATLFISNLRDDKTIPIYASTVLKNENGKKRTEPLNAIEYLFAFLDAYDFSSEGKEYIQEDNKTLINASVLGLIFEKINGYKDGSFFTPGFITMYMCRETLRKAVVQKFNDSKNWTCKDLDALYDTIEDRQDANTIINSIKICDPAVGSGHFLVSALNEMIAIKNDLKILQDRDGKRLKEYQFEVVNDELIVTDEDGELFEYNPTNKESQRIQEALFHEKQTIIEHCLFGVDINPNSVKICRLRLWIELLKNAYYKTETELETLPNIDINIKCGNSLISRFALDADLKKALKSSKWTIDSYKIAVHTYRNAQNKAQKREMEQLIADIKNDFRSEIALNDPKVKKLNKLKGDIFGMTNQTQMFEMSKSEKTAWNKKLKKLTEEAKKLETIIEEIKNNKIYENAFEWRFEFPEVLDDKGDFVGFDAVIGNPPYGAKLSNNEKKWFLGKFKNQDYQLDTYLLFIEQVYSLLKKNGEFTFIIPNTWVTNLKLKSIRKFIFENTFIHEIVHYKKAVFDEAVVDTQLLFFKKENKANPKIIINVAKNLIQYSSSFSSQLIWKSYRGEPVNIYLTKKESLLKTKLEKHKTLESLTNVVSGMNPYEVGKGKPKQTREMVKSRIYDSNFKIDETYKKVLRGSDINKYITNWVSNVWIKYGDNLAAPRYSGNFFNKEKIVVRQTSDRLIATLDTDKFVCLKNLHVITHSEEKIDFKFLLGLINSKLLDFYYTLLNPEKGEALAEVKKANLSRLPINLNNIALLQKISKKVGIILELKRKNLEVDTIDLEQEIDKLVYNLYGITEEEIKLIES